MLKYRNSKIISLILIMAIFGLALYSSNTGAEVDEKLSGEKSIVAVVNGEKINRQQLDQYAKLQQLAGELYNNYPRFVEILMTTETGEDLLNEYRKVKLDGLINGVLLEQKAETIDISEAEKEEIFTSHVESLKRNYNLSDEEILATLKEQGYENLAAYQNAFFAGGGKISVLQNRVLKDISLEEGVAEDFYSNNQDDFVDENDEIKSFTEVKEDIEGYLLQQKHKNAWEEYVSELREKADIEKII